MLQELSQEMWKNPARLHNLYRIWNGELAPEVAKTPYTEVANWGRVRLLKYAPQGPVVQAPILMIPSIINKYYVLDLRPNQSFIEYLIGKGIPVYLLDWGTPSAQDRFATLEDHVVRWMGAAVRHSCQDAKTAKIHLLGYCVGGTFAILHTALKPERIASLIALTAPVNFHDEGLLSQWASSKQLDVARLADFFGLVPAEFLNSSFSMLSPLGAGQKARGLVEKLWDEDFLEKFLALEMWLNDNIAFPGATYAEYIKTFYEENRLMKDELQMGGQKIRLSDIKVPVLTISASKDHIVPCKSANVLHERISSTDKELCEIKGGHIGITVGSNARDGLWSKTFSWLEHRPCPLIQ